ncbi:WHG domain-containing protein [Rhodococcus triatomae]|uniref:WHG domain-containing protein n=1 Tax=Rhodococcus triatomae TaxID=300028 RepID=A0A1G8A8G9_9NOCA|nr:TetR/AcrR family transcriptional regulator [Rhodococcus triatomae]SDH17218.1 WHG domain-containing protein [Rhodococcus triatomae]
MSEQQQERRRVREAAIVATARDIAEREGWAAITTRRLSAEVGYSQPVLYSHFASMDAIVTAVAVQGSEEIADALQRSASASEPIENVARAYLDLARDQPALYEAISSRARGLAFATPKAPNALQRAFGAIAEAVGGDETRAELFWGTLHGLAELERGGRLRTDARDARISELVQLYGAAGTP